MIEPVVMGLIVLYFFTREIFKKPSGKSPEKQLGEALTRYLESGVKTKE